MLDHLSELAALGVAARCAEGLAVWALAATHPRLWALRWALMGAWARAQGLRPHVYWVRQGDYARRRIADLGGWASGEGELALLRWLAAEGYELAEDERLYDYPMTTTAAHNGHDGMVRWLAGWAGLTAKRARVYTMYERIARACGWE